MTVSVIANDVGIAMHTTIALRHEWRKKTMTSAVRNTPSSSVRSTAWICCSV